MSVGSFAVCAILALLTWVMWKIKTRLNYWQSRGIACEEPAFLFGNMNGCQAKRGFYQIWADYYKKFKGTGPFAGFYLFLRPAAFILEPFLIKNILIKDFQKFTDRGFFYSNEKDDPLTGQLFLLDGLKWKNMRNKLSPTFTSGKMKFMFPTVIEVGREFINVFESLVKDNSIVEVKELLTRFTTDVIGTCAFGINCNSLKDPEAEFRLMGRRSLIERRHNAIVSTFMEGFPELAAKLHLKQTPEPIERFFMRIVRETVAEREANNIRRNDFMDMLIDLKNNKLLQTDYDGDMKNLTLEELAAQAFVFFTAGFETSSTTMGFALYELARNPEIQQKAREEILAVMKTHDNELTYEGMKEMCYLDQIISETLRLYTVLPILNRQALEDYVVPGYPNYEIKKGTPILIPAGALHRDADYYPNPDVFNPDNFDPEIVKERDSVLFLPFGEGPRNCIGLRFGQMQARIGLALLLKNFKFSVCDQTQIPMQYDKKSFLITSNKGIYLKVDRF